MTDPERIKQIIERGLAERDRGLRIPPGTSLDDLTGPGVYVHKHPSEAARLSVQSEWSAEIEALSREAARALNRRIIAVDFDGTLCENRWPEIGAPRWGVLLAVLDEQRRGARIILWTNRCGDRLAEAVAWCEARGLHFDAVNENLPEIIELYGSDSRKITADVYIDDRVLSADVLEDRWETEQAAMEAVTGAGKHGPERAENEKEESPMKQKETTITVELTGTVQATVVLPEQDAEQTIERGDHERIAAALLTGLLGRADHVIMKDGAEVTDVKVFDTGAGAGGTV